jgi:hypothetical protein
MPNCAIRAAQTAACAAQPQWIRFTVPPVRLASMIPPAMDAAIPIALAMPLSGRSSSVETAPAAAIAPQMEVAC